MAEGRALGDMSEDDVLDFAGACAETARRAEVDLLRAAHQWSVLHSADRLDPGERGKPGREKARQFGGEAVHLMTPADTFPFASCTTRTMQVDHTVPHARGGVSGVGNYGPMTTTHHRIKTHGRWRVEQPYPGIFVWRDPHGAFYLVDHTGTRRVPGATTDAAPPRPHRTVVVELWRSPFQVEVGYAA